MDPLARYRRRLARLNPDHEGTVRMPVQRRAEARINEAHPVDDEDDDREPDPDAPSAEFRKRWVGNLDDDRRERELRDAIRAGGWPAYVPGPNDPHGEVEPARPVAEAELIEWANLVSKRQSRLDAVILRERFARWADLPDTKYVEPLALLRDVIEAIDGMIENKGGHQPIEGDR
jgi:hypothetical protein